MNRTALRLATVAALSNGMQSPWPTLAGARIYDSRADWFGAVSDPDLLPVAVVYTDRDSRTARDGASIRMHNRSADLRIEISLSNRSKDEHGQPIAWWPDIDADLEAMLDLFELQVEAALFGAGPWAQWWQKKFTARGFDSERFGDVGKGEARLAARQLIIPVTLPSECLPRPRLEGEDAPPPGGALWADVCARVGAFAAQPMQDMAERLQQLVTGGAPPPFAGSAPIRSVRMMWRDTKRPVETVLEAELAGPLPEQL